MFFLWVNIIKIKKINRIKFISVPPLKFGSIDFTTFSLIIVTTNTVREENIEDKEEYLNIRDTTNQVKTNNKLNP